ncbi:hypothetical protein BCR32DRAFT_283179 [Anaeromyces robustus]|uniref:Condensation domain-containing protein n=1 Tax=Anaeromyces robustus TaxID=1754192 RepID=A0A1Y1WV96_9FUNG|nr:hypothetical protein BCR32DRAFT_283179 [Anaeromyces robustus]|eukprot:ORX77433.1 hypothetical protein BCR32DRAFT_283179 [Anaeromyces robustus]
MNHLTSGHNLNSKENSENPLNFLKERFNCDFNVLAVPKKEYYQKFRGNEKVFKHQESLIINDYYEKVKGFVESNHLNPVSLLLSIYGFVMYKYTGQEIIYTLFCGNDIGREEGRCSDEEDITTTITTQPFLIKCNKNGTLMDIFNDIDHCLTYYYYHYKNPSILFSEISES